MATAQRMRTSEKQISGWNAIFPNDVATQHQSLVFIKRMMALGVSCITYLRGIFPEDAYRTRYLEGMCVKILREDSRFPGASKVVKWMMGCFDALEKRFLRTIILGVHRDPEDPNSIIESYQFKFKYTADGPKLDILSKNKQVSLQDTKKASILLIRKLFVLMQSLEILPNDVSLTMKLFYYDEVTPPEYQPPGFKQGECDAVWFEGTPVHFKVGDVPTPFHMMKVRVTTEKETMEQLEKENMLNEENETSVQGLEEVNSTPNVRNTVKEDTPFYQNITAHSELQRSVTNEQSFSESEKEIKQLVAKAAELNVSGKRTKLRKVLVQRNNLQDNGKVNEEPQKLSTTPAIKAVRAKKSISELDHTACDSAVLQEKITKRRRKN
ncbi:HORMA domain-containing protein 1-like isoform X1 [Scyliorhinus canicula]|uniref:HORMA domain-containing protein 1-like isoform X1 n=2 Tax=Scyliorhinus canicula TaxID=7830 RepID=UPI0018F75FAE|nr:HORMA domain-containing protein 1-like isoform X1 [Scyliorhinus canicula]XP_038650074.1 HORMA domain-containing protein 1-like isoform X1 [Scyliorhinus canicula]XP_038650075.1 HORMA domain-containing protein 1-like isoform X1 [Scyliorhinus canicula]